MNTLSQNARSLIKQKLKEQYEHLTDADLTGIDNPDGDWLLRVQRLVGGSPLAIAFLIEEAIAAPSAGATLWPSYERERISA